MASMAGSDPRNLLRRIPSVNYLLNRSGFSAALELYGRELVRVQIGVELERLREEVKSAAGVELEPIVDDLPRRVLAGLEERLGAPIRRVINATGIFLHTNLGRAPLPPEVAARLPALVDASCDLELELATGQRGDRNRATGDLLATLTGGEAGLVVNNNAGALVLILATLAHGREVIVSRGELVEIGGSFRIPDMLTAAGAQLVEVGTTNRTRVADYETAIGDRTALLLKVHTSNYRQIGFVESVAETELVALGRRAGLPVVVDEGGGLLRPRDAAQLADHPSHHELLAAGCDLVCGSGDKLLGGPQAGLIAGRRETVERCRKHPLYRALRPSRMTLVTLAEVLRRHLVGAPLPLDRLWVDPADHRRRLDAVAGRIGAEVIAAESYLGGGAAPERPIAGEALALPDDADLLARLRTGDPAVVGYLRHGRLVLDLRTVDPDDDAALAEAVRNARRAVSGTADGAG